jgi:riboflavin-specific deaminase-like protein
VTIKQATAVEPHDGWDAVLDAARDGGPIPPPWDALYGPILDASHGNSFLLAQLGQSLDGRIATSTGRSRYINGRDCLVHLHRLRSLVDIVIVGVGTVIADDPQLTVRLVDGPSPACAVIDPNGRMPSTTRLLADTQKSVVLITRETTKVDLPRHVQVVRLPADANGRLNPVLVRGALEAAGYRRMLLEGGATTVSGFLDADCVDRLHLLVAPIIIGAGQAGISLPATDRLEDVRRPVTTAHVLGPEVVFDCDFRAAAT